MRHVCCVDGVINTDLIGWPDQEPVGRLEYKIAPPILALLLVSKCTPSRQGTNKLGVYFNTLFAVSELGPPPELLLAGTWGKIGE